MLYVIALNLNDAWREGAKYGWRKQEIRFVDGVGSLVGVRGIDLYITDGAQHRDDYSDIVDMAIYRQCQTVYI